MGTMQLGLEPLWGPCNWGWNHCGDHATGIGTMFELLFNSLMWCLHFRMLCCGVVKFLKCIDVLNAQMFRSFNVCLCLSRS